MEFNMNLLTSFQTQIIHHLCSFDNTTFIRFKCKYIPNTKSTRQFRGAFQVLCENLPDLRRWSNQWGLLDLINMESTEEPFLLLFHFFKMRTQPIISLLGGTWNTCIPCVTFIDGFHFYYFKYPFYLIIIRWARWARWARLFLAHLQLNSRELFFIQLN